MQVPTVGSSQYSSKGAARKRSSEEEPRDAKARRVEEVAKNVTFKAQEEAGRSKDSQANITNYLEYYKKHPVEVPTNPSSKSYANGDKYEGDIQMGLRQGKGTCTYAEGTKYTGDWKNDERHGKGTCTYAEGTKYTGDWKNDERHGKGIFTFSDGTTYNGEWKNGLRHGKGVRTYPNRSTFTGVWQNGLKHGEGVVKKADGSVVKGVWQLDEHVIESSSQKNNK